MPESDSEISAEGHGFKLRARGYDTIVVVMILALAVFGYGLNEHMRETKSGTESVAKAINDSVKVQKFTACILATKDELRESQYSNPNSFCNRMAQ